MRNTLTIAGKELQGYFVQPVAYVVLTVFLLLGGWFFFAMLRQFDEMIQMVQMMGQTDSLKQMNLNTRVIDPLLHDLSIVLVIVMPALTMRVFAEEKRTGTYELLLTAPVRTGEIVAGKFLATGAFTLIMVALAWIFPLILTIFGDPELGVMFAGYLGLGLLALSFAAVGLFTSSLTQNQIVAAISSFGVLILLYVISWPAEAGGGVVSSVLQYLSLPEHFSTMTRGVVDTTDIVFFMSVIVLALFLTQRSVESARWR
ncbi:MAG: ABC transporter permease subunit [Candidatus Binataceae bacterium]|nr:ABC transporter permease subunit [Candidatus Binataceae bacterium]